MTFSSEEERREHFLGILREKLKDPEFRKIEGFPLGTDEDILALSDPPYYTACPNPFLGEFIKQYGKPYEPETDNYRREPFATDVSEGKNDPIYNAHTYHTKVPHKAIMRYILHYTEPGDMVFDGFCGTGMTGVAAQMCGNQSVVESLGYRVGEDGTISQKETDGNGKTSWKPFSKLGARRAILNDLSPAATFIAYNYNTPVDVAVFENEAKRILAEVEAECGWMYETKHSDGCVGKINYTVWSDVFVCPECTREVIFWEAAVDKEAGKVQDDFSCPHCGARLTKRSMERAWVTKYDKAIDQTVRQAKQVPVLINYSVGKKRHEKAPDSFDLALIEKIEGMEIPYWFPTERMPEGEESRRNDSIAITHVHHFYTKRNLWV
ncbi:MAG TPA: DNA methyltransferase, partial [Thermotogota bacterium]|nr:DNA methyltransferase [Thermotogota bacterium]